MVYCLSKVMNTTSFQRLVRQFSTLAVFACSFVKTIVDSDMPSHDKPINIIELSVYFVLEVLCHFDLAHAGLLNNRHYMFIQYLQQKLNGSKCIELVCTLKWNLKIKKKTPDLHTDTTLCSRNRTARKFKQKLDMMQKLF